MIFLKKFFSAQSTEKKYKYEIIPFVLLTVLYSVIVIILNLLENTNIILFIIYVLFIFQLVLLFIRLTCVADNRKILRFKNNEIKMKFSSIKVDFKDIMVWLEKSVIPDTLYVKSVLGKRFIIEISFETTSIRGKFINKTIWFDDVRITSIGKIKEIIEKNQILDMDDNIEIEAITEFNDPKLFYEIFKK